MLSSVPNWPSPALYSSLAYSDREEVSDVVVRVSDIIVGFSDVIVRRFGDVIMEILVLVTT